MNNVLLLLFVKHFICDFPLQAFPYQYKNKGIYGHKGGLLHSLIHGSGTLISLLACGYGFRISVLMGLLDYVFHYHIDWVKVNVGKRYNLTPTNSEWFWILLGLDQFLHTLTYFLIVGLL